MIGTFLGEDLWAFGGGAGKLEGPFHGFGARVAKEAGVARGAKFFDESLGEETGENGAVHLNHIGEIEFENVLDGLLDGGVVAADIEDAVAAKEVEVVLAVEIVEVGTFCAGINFIKADRALNIHEGTIDEFIVQVVVLPESGEDRVFEIECGHGSY